MRQEGEKKGKGNGQMKQLNVWQKKHIDIYRWRNNFWS